MSAPRPAGPGDDLLGVAPRQVSEPASLEEAAEALRACARDRLRVAFVGGGTDLGLGNPPSGLDLVLRTGRLARVVEHAPADQVVVVEAGVTIAALQRALAPHRQRLALDPPLPERATVGGVVAANASGPGRTRTGTARDLIIGATLVRADGVVARGGGKVVKNVAGFDLPRLLVGSLGTLGLIASVTFRLHPLPEATATFQVPSLGAAQARALVRAMREAQLEPAAVALFLEAGASLRLGIRFEGFEPGVRQQGERLMALAAAAGLGADRLDTAEADRLWARHQALRSTGDLRLKAAAPPSALEPLLRDALVPLGEALGDGGAVVDPTLGVAALSGTPLDGPGTVAALVQARRAVVGLGGSLVVAAAPAALRAGLDAWGPPPASLGVMRRLKAQLDPEGRLAPGRFVGGI